ncbi:MAG TPA: RluA family pseudouridine synthase [Candidatus Atribacteria bacterium]|nr:RluA family pseudouridine synthase [Candidatus Atribacteria bacterium]HPT79386.1 RluA family pseudouridine synthase [Candidatus Atribacteria bacterium]
MKEIRLTTTEENAGQRIDVFLASQLPEYSRSYLQNLIKQGNATVEGAQVKANYKVKPGEEILLAIPPARQLAIEPENIELEYIYEDNDIAVINKPQGMVVHPAPGNYSGTLVNALLHSCRQLSSINGVIRPGIVHRIDKDTSGLLVIAKNDMAHRELAKQLKDKTMSRVYMALAEKNFKQDEGTIDAPIGRNPVDRKKMAVVERGRNAVTHYKVLERFGEYTLLMLELTTGRTHQIRVHLSHIGHPIVGDPLYGSKKQRFTLNGQALHAYKLRLVHPSTGEPMEFEAPLPDYFNKLLDNLRNRR